jgi:hypothetical protein
VLLEPLIKNSFGDVRLEEPHRLIAHVALRHALPEPGEGLSWLPLPGLG